MTEIEKICETIRKSRITILIEDAQRYLHPKEFDKEANYLVDEIERLNADVNRLTKIVDLQETREYNLTCRALDTTPDGREFLKKHAQEVERLTAENEKDKRIIEVYLHDGRRLLDENAQLRAALDDMLSLISEHGTKIMWSHKTRITAARNALKGEGRGERVKQLEDEVEQLNERLSNQKQAVEDALQFGRDQAAEVAKITKALEDALINLDVIFSGTNTLGMIRLFARNTAARIRQNTGIEMLESEK